MAENGEPKEAYTSLAERQVAEWVLENRHHAGYATRHFPNAICQYYAIALNLEVFAVVGIDTEKESIGTFESSILISILGECALALENEKNAREKEEAHVQAQKEQTRANLIRAISHDLRTPLTTITGNASYLLSEESCFDEQMKRQIYSDIYDDSMWLNDLVDNLLSISRIEDGTMRMHPTAELLDECVEEALKHLDRRCCEHTIVREYAPDLVLVNVEARLIVQLVINLVNNAIKYTQKGSTIWVRIRVAPDGFAYLEVADDGPGVADEEKEHIFEMFYTSGRKAADSRRSLGLGLALCRSIVQAHGGEIRVLDNEPCGTRFVCTLPLTQMDGMQELS